MELKVKITQILPEQSGTSKTGKSWVKQQFVAEPVDAQYPKPIKFDAFNPDEHFPVLRAGTIATLSFDVDSRPYTGRDGVERWNTSVNVWRAVIDNGQQEPQQFSATVPSASAFGSTPVHAASPAGFAPASAAVSYPEPEPSNSDLPF